VLLDPRRVMYAEDPAVEIESSRNAAVQMDTAPSGTAGPVD